jgi:predicted class III extradiol MEMO1 family dioxygenase
VFVLGPSHHVYTRECLLSRASHYCTPLGADRHPRCTTSTAVLWTRLPTPEWTGDVEVDQAVCSELRATGAFKYMDLDVDEVRALCVPLALPALLALRADM